MPPAPEDHGQHHHRQPGRDDRPADTDRIDPVGDIGQPWCPHVGEQAQEPRVGLITQPAPRCDLGEQEGTGHDDDREQDPRRGADGDGMRQRRGRTRGAPLPTRFLDASAPGLGGRRGRGRRHRDPLCVLAHGTHGLLGDRRVPRPPTGTAGVADVVISLASRRRTRRGIAVPPCTAGSLVRLHERQGRTYPFGCGARWVKRPTEDFRPADDRPSPGPARPGQRSERGGSGRRGAGRRSCPGSGPDARRPCGR